MINFPFSNVLR